MAPRKVRHEETKAVKSENRHPNAIVTYFILCIFIMHVNQHFDDYFIYHKTNQCGNNEKI